MQNFILYSLACFCVIGSAPVSANNSPNSIDEVVQNLAHPECKCPVNSESGFDNEDCGCGCGGKNKKK